MTVTEAGLNAAADGLVDEAAWGSIHTADPGPSGDNEVTGGGYTRVPIVWDPASGGAAATDGTLEFSGPANEDALYFGIWTAQTGGTFLGSAPLVGDQAFNTAGQYTVTAADVTASTP